MQGRVVAIMITEAVVACASGVGIDIGRVLMQVAGEMC